MLKRLFPEIAKKHEELKLTLAQLFSNTNHYAAAKTDFIKEIDYRAKQYFEGKLLQTT